MNKDESDLPIIDNDLIEAIAILTNKTVGDVHSRINDGEFVLLAIEALRGFSTNYRLIEKIEDSDPVEDDEILKKCILDLTEELSSTVDPDRRAELKADIDAVYRRVSRK